MKRIHLTTILTGGFLLTNFSPLFAQVVDATPAAAPDTSPFTMLYLALACLIMVIVFETILVQKMMKLIAEQNYKLLHGTEMPSQQTATAKEAAGVAAVIKKEPFGARLWKTLTKSARKGRERDVV